MKFIREENGDLLSTPIYVGTAHDVEIAIRCKHEFVESPDTAEESEGYNLVLERCTRCVACRTRSSQVAKTQGEN